MLDKMNEFALLIIKEKDTVKEKRNARISY